MLDKRIILTLVLGYFVCAAMASAASDAATIHGAVYEWDTFSPLENVIVEVNSTPSQSLLARYGVYSFNLPPGDYTITASYYGNNTLISYAEENITITDNGDYVLDLILLPADMDLFYENEFSELEEIAAFAEEDDGISYVYIIAFFIILIIVSGAYLYSKQKNGHAEDAAGSGVEDSDDVLIPEIHMDDSQTLPDDLSEVIGIINAAGGRMTQRELRTKVKYSEAKVSLMLSDLEDRGLIRKFKKGRGNVIILADRAD